MFGTLWNSKTSFEACMLGGACVCLEGEIRHGMNLLNVRLKSDSLFEFFSDCSTLFSPDKG